MIDTVSASVLTMSSMFASGAMPDPKKKASGKGEEKGTKHGGNLGDPYLGLMDGGSRTDYNNYDWSGRQVDDYKDVRRKGSDA